MGGDTSPLMLFEAASRAALFLKEHGQGFPKCPLGSPNLASTEKKSSARKSQSLSQNLSQSTSQDSFQNAQVPLHLSFTFFSEPSTSFFGSSFPLPCNWVKAGPSICMEDAPLVAVRKKKNSSLLLGVKALADRSIDAFITTSNTGALVASGCLYLKPEDNFLERPALLATLPGETKPFCLLDAGATLHYKGDGLARLGALGAAWHRKLFHSDIPRLALLNIGTESLKGKQEQKEAREWLQKYAKEERFEFLGNIEPQNIFSSGADLLLTDGFSGNIFLKVFEGTFAFLEKMKQPDIRPLKKHLQKRALPFAFLIGLSGIVVKCHGNTSPGQFERTLTMLPEILLSTSR